MTNELTKRISGVFASFTVKAIQAEADKERRSFNSMLEILALEAIERRNPIDPVETITQPS